MLIRHTTMQEGPPGPLRNCCNTPADTRCSGNCSVTRHSSQNMLTFVDVNNSQQLHENVKLTAISNGKACSQTNPSNTVRFRNYFTTVLKSSTWSTESIWIFSLRNHIAHVRLSGSFRIVGNFSQTTAIWTHRYRRKWYLRDGPACVRPHSLPWSLTQLGLICEREHLVLLLLFIISYNIFQHNLS